jgi:hypothetical protein
VPRTQPLPPDLDPIVSFCDPVLGSPPDAYSLALWQNVSAGASLSSHSGQISIDPNHPQVGQLTFLGRSFRVSGQSNLSWYHHTMSTPHCPGHNPFSTSPVTVLCCAEGNPIAQTHNGPDQPAQTSLRPPFLFPMPAYFTSRVVAVSAPSSAREGRAEATLKQILHLDPKFPGPLPAAVSNDISHRDKKGGR